MAAHRFQIEEDDAERLIEEYDRRDSDKLDLRRRCRDTNADIVRFSQMLLTGRAAVAADVPVAALDLVGAHLIAHMGVHPGAAAAMAAAARGIGIRVDDEKEPRICLLHPEDRGTLESVDVRLDKVRWHYGRFLVEGLPATLVTALGDVEDLPLARILLHPALDPLGLAILSMESLPGERNTDIRVDSDLRPLTRAELDEIWDGRHAD